MDGIARGKMPLHKKFRYMLGEERMLSLSFFPTPTFPLRFQPVPSLPSSFPHHSGLAASFMREQGNLQAFRSSEIACPLEELEVCPAFWGKNEQKQVGQARDKPDCNGRLYMYDWLGKKCDSCLDVCSSKILEILVWHRFKQTAGAPLSCKNHPLVTPPDLLGIVTVHCLAVN